MKTPKAVKDFLRTIAAKGGKKKSQKKLSTAKANLKKARAARWPQKGGSA